MKMPYTLMFLELSRNLILPLGKVGIMWNRYALKLNSLHNP